MRAGVHDHVRDVVVREVRVIGMAVEGELEDLRPGQAELVAQGEHVGRDQPQVLGDER